MSGSGIGTILGGAGGALLGSPQLGAGIGGLLGGMFGGSSQPDDRWIRDEMAKYGATADKWFDPNNSFYTKSAQNQKQNLMDMYLAGNRERRKQLASQGINSQYMNNTMQKDAMSKSAEGANNFALQNYKQGLGVGQQFAGMAQNMAGILANSRQQGADTQNSMNNNFMGIGAGLLGNALGSGQGLSLSQGAQNISNMWDGATTGKGGWDAYWGNDDFFQSLRK